MDLTIEPDYNQYTRETRFTVWKHDEYPEHSVLHGRPRRTAIDDFDTPEEAAAAYPDADVLDYSTRYPDSTYDIGPHPESWFDPAAAGERWDDDY